MSISGVQTQWLEITVVKCTNLKDIERIKRQESYVCVEYGSTKFRTRTCTDGNKNPVFKEKFVLTLIEGLKEINVVVWNSNPISYDHFLGSVRVQLQDVLSRGFDEKSWPLQTKTGRCAGEVKLIMHYDQANRPTPIYTPNTPSYTAILTPSTSSYTNPAFSHSALGNPSATATYQPLNSAHERRIPPPSPHQSIYPPPPYPAPAGNSFSPYSPPLASPYAPPGLYEMYTQPPY